MEKKLVRLTKVWAGHQPGEVVEEDAPCADSMVRKGYGVIVPDPKARRPVIETAAVTPVAETAVVPLPAVTEMVPPAAESSEPAGKKGRRPQKAGE